MAVEIAQVLDKLYPVQHILAKREIEIEIQKDGLVVWLCVDGVMAARVISNGFIPIKIIDRRNHFMEGE